MKAVAIRAFGSPEGLALVDLPDPRPEAGEVLIATEAIGVGGVDALILSGALAAYGFEVGHILGGEIAGTVTAVGEGVDGSWVGRRVWAFTGLDGGYVEQVVAPVAAVVALPAELSAVDAVTLGSSGVVAHFGLRHARFERGESVLVRGAAAVAVTTSSADRGERLRALGATHVLDRAGEAHDAITGYDVIIDVIAGADVPSFLAKLNPNGRMVAIGAIAGPPPTDFGMTLFAAFQRSWSFGTFSANTVTESDRRTATAGVFAAAVRGELRAVVHEVLDLEQAVVAHQRLQAGAVFGRLVLVPGGI
jgi:NADPH:quinone reductase-like Zn-dependent oxidoreductase